MQSTILSTRGSKDTIFAVRHTISLIRGSKTFRHLTPDAQVFIDDQLFGCRWIDRGTPMSALQARVRHSQALHQTVQFAFDDLLGNWPLPIFATFSFLDDEVPMWAPLRNSQTSLNVVVEALKRHGLEGILMPDIDLLLLSDAEQPIVAPHWHGLVTPIAGRIKLKSTERKMNNEVGLASRLRKAVALGGKRPGDPRRHAENMATYLAKHVSALKDATRWNNGAPPERGRQKFGPEHALAGLHAWSQLPLLDSVIPVGEFGHSIHSSWLRRVKRTRDPHARDARFTRRDLRQGWADILPQIRCEQA